MTAKRQLGWLLRFSLGFALLWALPALAADQDCLACHSDPGMKSASGRSLHVDPIKHKSSVHGDLGCATCHVGVKEYPHPAHMRKPACSTCHDQEVADVPKSVHSILGADACASCHGSTHDVQRNALPATTLPSTAMSRAFTP